MAEIRCQKPEVRYQNPESGRLNSDAKRMHCDSDSRHQDSAYPSASDDSPAVPATASCSGSAVPATALTIDWDLYAEHLAESDLTDDQKREFIETLWAIVVAFVDLGFGVHPIQQATENGHEFPLLSPEDVVYLETNHQQKQNDKPATDGLRPLAE